MATLNFTAAPTLAANNFDVVPAGWYNVRITESINKPTKDGQGSYLALTLTIIDGQYANRKLFDRLNLNNKNPKAVEIARDTLTAICHAVGVFQVPDSTVLHGLPMQCKVTVRPADGKYDESNEVKAYKAISGGSASQPVPAFVQQAAAPSPAQSFAAPAAVAAPAATPPWAA